jgi:hypothetical protein
MKWFWPFSFSYIRRRQIIWRKSLILLVLTNSAASVREQTLPTESRLSVNLVPTFEDTEFRVVIAMDPNGRNLGLPDRSRYFIFQVAPQLCSRGWMDLVPDPLLLRKSGSHGNGIRDLWIYSQKLWTLDNRAATIGFIITKSFRMNEKRKYRLLPFVIEKGTHKTP